MADSRAIHDLFWTRLDAIAGVNAYDGEVPATPPIDGDGRVHAYAVLYAFGGSLRASALAGAQTSVLGGCQVTCVGGDPTRALWCLDKVRAGLAGLVTVDGAPRVIRASEVDPGSVRRDDDVRPPRHYLTPEFQLFAP